MVHCESGCARSGSGTADVVAALEYVHAHHPCYGTAAAVSENAFL